MTFRDDRSTLEGRRQELRDELAHVEARLSGLAAPRRFRLVLVLLGTSALLAGAGAVVFLRRAPAPAPIESIDAPIEPYCEGPIPAPAEPGLVLQWGWGGGITGQSCSWSLYQDYRVEGRGCRPGQPTKATVRNGATARLLSLANGLAPYSEHDNCGVKGVDRIETGLSFHGRGTRPATAEQKAWIRTLVSGAEPMGP